MSLFTSFGTKRTEEELLMSYNIKWFEVEVWRGKPPDGVPEYMKEPLTDESPVKSPTSPNKEKRSRAGSYALQSSIILVGDNAINSLFSPRGGCILISSTLDGGLLEKGAK